MVQLIEAHIRTCFRYWQVGVRPASTGWPGRPAWMLLATRVETDLPPTSARRSECGWTLVLDRLWVDYTSVSGNLRQVVAHAHGALVHACDSASNIVSGVHVDQAID